MLPRVRRQLREHVWAGAMEEVLVDEETPDIRTDERGKGALDLVAASHRGDFQRQPQCPGRDARLLHLGPLV